MSENHDSDKMDVKACEEWRKLFQDQRKELLVIINGIKEGVDCARDSLSSLLEKMSHVEHENEDYKLELIRLWKRTDSINDSLVDTKRVVKDHLEKHKDSKNIQVRLWVVVVGATLSFFFGIVAVLSIWVLKTVLSNPDIILSQL